MFLISFTRNDSRFHFKSNTNSKMFLVSFTTNDSISYFKSKLNSKMFYVSITKNDNSSHMKSKPKLQDVPYFFYKKRQWLISSSQGS